MADGTLAQSLLGVAQNTNEAIGQGGNDALQAYHIAATAEHARQELEMEKEKQTMNKASWLGTQLDAISKMGKGTQRLALESLQKQGPQALGSAFNPQIIDAFKADEDLKQHAFIHSAQTVSGGGIKTAQQAQDFLDTYGGSVTDASAALSTYGQHYMGMLGASAKAAAINAGADGRNTNFANQTHLKYIDKAMGDSSTTGKLLTTYNNLYNATQNYAKGGATPQEFSELQQAVRSNVGIKGTSGVDERGDTYLRSLGINKDKLTQFLSGNPQSVMDSDPKFSAQILKVADLEMDNKSKQASSKIDASQAGGGTFYKVHPDLAQDFNNEKQKYLQQFNQHRAGQTGNGGSSVSSSGAGSSSGGPPAGSVIKLKDGSMKKVMPDGSLSDVK